MKNHNCETCSFRKKYDTKPNSFLGRLWRWHINWCPGWGKYYRSLDENKKQKIVHRYGLKK